MELLKVSKFKLQLQTLIAEVRELRERERSANEQIHLLIQKQKKTEEEQSRRLQYLEAELASSNELRQKLERKVSCLQSDNAVLENKQKELKGTINSLLQSRENFINAYEEFTCGMKRSILTRDQNIFVLSEKINSHLSLFESIEKEASSVKQLVDNVQTLVSEKEGIVAGLRSKMDQVSALEKVLVEKFFELQNKSKNDEEELRRKNKIISELEAQLKAVATSNNFQAQIEELQKMLSAKDAVIQNISSERMALQVEVRSLEAVFTRIQKNIRATDEVGEQIIYVDQRALSLTLEDQDKFYFLNEEETNRNENAVQVQNACDRSSSKAFEACAGNAGSPQCPDNKSVSICLQENYSNASESAPLEPQSVNKNIYMNNDKDNGTLSMDHLDSECSTTQAETVPVPV